MIFGIIILLIGLALDVRAARKGKKQPWYGDVIILFGSFFVGAWSSESSGFVRVAIGGAFFAAFYFAAYCIDRFLRTNP